MVQNILYQVQTKESILAKILVVDDSETVRSTLREALEEAGHSVVITDFNMPQMDGVTMASKLREISGFSKTPILMLTTESTPDIKEAGRQAGILAWIVKPLVISKIMPAVDKILRK